MSRVRIAGLSVLVFSCALVMVPLAEAAPGNGNGQGSGQSSSRQPAGNSNAGGASGNSASGSGGSSNGNSSSSPAAEVPGQSGGAAQSGSPGNSGSAQASNGSSGHSGGNSSSGSAADKSPGSSGSAHSNSNSAAAESGAAKQSSSAAEAVSGASGSKRPAAKITSVSMSTRATDAVMSRAVERTAKLTGAAKARSTAISACLRKELAKQRKSSRATDPEPTTDELAALEDSCSDDIGQTGDYIVQFVPGSNAADAAEAARRKSSLREASRLKVKRVYSHVFPGMLVSANPRQIEALRKNPNVRMVEADGLAASVADQSPAPWGLDRIDQAALPLNGTYSYQGAGSGVTAYVIDTGIRATHQDFSGRVGAGYSAIADGNGIGDCNGHGTHVSGTIAGSAYGVAKAVTLIPVRVLDCSGSGTWSGVIAGLDWAAGHHAAGAPAVANMSLGGGVSSSVDTAVRSLIADGVTVVVAAGNSAVDACTSSPARVTEAITVAASDSTDAQAPFSNVGSCVDLYAPGVSISSDWYSSDTASAVLSGTSMASPHVAGAASLLLASATGSTPAAIQSALIDGATVGALTSVTGGTPNRLLRTMSGSPVSPPPAEQPVAQVPGVATGVTALAGSKSATVSWTAAPDGGSPLTGQSVLVYDDRGRRAGTISIAGSLTSVTITGLAPRKRYSFSVVAINTVGAGAESSRSNQVLTAR